MRGPLLPVGDASGAEALEHTFVVLSAVSLCLVAPLVLTFVVFKRKFPSYLVLSFLVCSMGLPLFSLFNAFFGFVLAAFFLFPPSIPSAFVLLGPLPSDLAVVVGARACVGWSTCYGKEAWPARCKPSASSSSRPASYGPGSS
jgi:hypothetical protein